MSEQLTIQARPRQLRGKGASRRLRNLEGMVPGIVYGGDKGPKNISVEARVLEKALQSEGFYSQIFTLVVDGEPEQVVLKDLQRHPARNMATHADFLRIAANRKLQKNIPLHFINEEQCKGVKAGGGVISRLISEVEIRCFPADLPEYIEVDMSEVELGQVIHLSDIKLPNAGIELVQLALGGDHDQPVVMVTAQKAAATEEVEAPKDAPEAS